MTAEERKYTLSEAMEIIHKRDCFYGHQALNEITEGRKESCRSSAPTAKPPT